MDCDFCGLVQQEGGPRDRCWGTEVVQGKL